jgi:DMSO/TMAO reductase YedYZ molybdopterin-dependent catalytic subunit
MRKSAGKHIPKTRNMLFGIILLPFIILAASGSFPALSSNKTPEAMVEKSTDKPSVMAIGPNPCDPPAVIAPAMPEKIPGYADLDPATNLHVTGTPQQINIEEYRLEVSGKVNHTLSLSYDDLRCMPRIEARPRMVCPGFFVDVATWAGAKLDYVLDLAGIQQEADQIRLISADGYSASVSLKQARLENNFLAYEWEGNPLPVLHGFPVRAVFPELEGNKWVKWLIRIEIN